MSDEISPQLFMLTKTFTLKGKVFNDYCNLTNRQCEIR